jgi:LDH2 family malate/lactate/ureidoglycolate dehydrogenase
MNKHATMPTRQDRCGWPVKAPDVSEPGLAQARNGRVDADVLRDFIERIMEAHGVDSDQVRTVAKNLVWNELVGRPNFGVLRLPILMERVRRGVLRGSCQPQFEAVSETMARLDGDDGFGQYVAEIGMRRAIAMAHKGGLGVVGVRNSNFFGTGAYFVQLAAEAGMMGFAASNSFPKVAAHGGILPALGTNPFAFSAPRRNGESMLLDLATSALAGSTVREHIAKGEDLPAGLVVDGNGAPITDPRKVADGALLPFGGAKGFGLALMVEILAGVITGAGVAHGVKSMYADFAESGHSGHFLLALDISRWITLEEYFARFETLIAAVRASNPNGGVRLPGEIRWQAFRENRDRGIRLEPRLMAALAALSEPCEHAI